jgi:hypothetical protein
MTIPYSLKEGVTKREIFQQFSEKCIKFYCLNKNEFLKFKIYFPYFSS